MAGPRRSAPATRRQYLAAAGGSLGGLAACGQSRTGAAPALVRGPAEITFTYWDPPEGQGFLNDISDGFRRTYPQVTVQRTQIAAGEYTDKVLVMITGGTAPDVASTQRPAFASWVVKGIVLPSTRTLRGPRSATLTTSPM